MPFILTITRVLLACVLLFGLPCVLAKAGIPYTFPDPGLQAAVADAIGKTTTELTLEDLSSPFFTLLPGESRKIRNLEGIEKCTSLIEVVLSDNEIEDLRPISKMTWLRSLSIDKNQIRDLTPLSSLVQLEDLWLFRNEISDLSPVKSISGLKALDVGANQIMDLEPVKELYGLVHLWVAENQIRDVSPLTALPYLETIDLANNKISDFHPFFWDGVFPRCTKIDVDNNPVCVDDWLWGNRSFEERGIIRTIDHWERLLDPIHFPPSVPGFRDTWKFSPETDTGFVFSVSSEASVDIVWGDSGYGLGLEGCKIRMARPIVEYPMSAKELDHRFITPQFKSSGVPDWPRAWKYFHLGGEHYFSKRLAQRINFSLQEQAVVGISVKFTFLYETQYLGERE